MHNRHQHGVKGVSYGGEWLDIEDCDGKFTNIAATCSGCESTIMFRRMGVPDFVTDGVDTCCPECWKEGCGLNGCFGGCADALEVVNPVVEQIGSLIWIFGSPLAFPCIFFFSPDPHTNESSGYEISMLQAPCKRPFTCCFATFCLPCGQWYNRRKVLGDDMSKYKLWQGYHDGPQCCARVCPSAPITIQAGTYGEEKCPNLFLCLEVWCLGGFYSVCCAFNVSRRYQRQERGLSLDPTEHRQNQCIRFFSNIMHQCFKLGCCMCITSCCLQICAPDSSGAQELAGETGRAARACCRIARTIWKGIQFTRVIGMGCMTAQMIEEANTPMDEKTRQNRSIGGEDVDKLLMPWDEEEEQQQVPQNQRMNR